MTSDTLSLLSSSRFPQFIDPMLALVDEVLLQNEPALCIHESPESHVGACDGGFPCHEIAVFGDFCKKHFEPEVLEIDPEATVDLAPLRDAAARLSKFRDTVANLHQTLRKIEFPQSLVVGDK